ncbi:MAG TPA: S-layer homology domain-containing protein, partial [Epulopiscium sp.]|nr:S-layer homology domain-containing protein [Candidatus Epulonipiscium sp.]
NYSEGIPAGLANSFSLEGKAEKAIGTGVLTLPETVGIKTEEAFRNSSLIGFLNISDPIWEQGLNYPIFFRTQVDVSGVSVLNKSYDTEEISYSGTPIAQLNATPITVEGYTYTWQYKGADETYSNMEGNIAPVDVGDYRLVVSVSDLDPNYGGRQEIDFTILSKVVSSPIITLEDSSYPYTGTAIEPAIIVKDGEKVIPADQYTISYLNNQEVGTASIIITAKEGVNYTVTGSTNFIIKGTLEGSVVIDNMAPSYGDILTVNVSGQQSDVLYQWKAGNENIGTNASTYQVEGEDIGKQITVTVTDPVYEGTLISLGTSEVTPKLVRVSGITADDKAYDGKLDAKLICNLAIITGLVTGETLTITADGIFEDANVGNKSVHISNIILLDASGSAANYVLAQSGNQAITTASITPTVIAGSFEANKLVGYMDTREQIISTNNFGINLAGEFTANGMIVDSDHVLKDVQYGENIIFTLNNGLSLNNQTASIPILFTAENGNYSPKELTLLVTLTDRQLVEITGLVPAGDLIYTGKAQSGYIGRVVVSGAEVPTDALIYTYTSADGVSYNSTTAPRDAGSYNLIVSIAGDHPNYTGNSNTINFTIDKKSLTAKADNKSMTEGEKLPKFTVSYPGIVDGDQEENIIKEQAVASCEADGKSRGSYTIIISNPVLTAEGDKNYTLGDSVTGTLDVKKKSSGGSSSGGSTSSGGGGSTTKPPVKEPDKQDPIIEDEDPDTPPDGMVPTVFTDIATHWAKKDIEFVTARGLFTGTGDKKFSPNIPMTRGMFVTVLGRLASADISSYTISSFGDVKSDAYYMGYIQWASENSIVAGVSQNQFTPDMAITREQMAVILYRYSQYKGYDTSQGGMAIREFTDYESISDYGRQAMGWAVNNGLIQGSDRNLMPKESATRAQIAAILKRYSQL